MIVFPNSAIIDPHSGRGIVSIMQEKNNIIPLMNVRTLGVEKEFLECHVSSRSSRVVCLHDIVKKVITVKTRINEPCAMKSEILFYGTGAKKHRKNTASSSLLRQKKTIFLTLLRGKSDDIAHGSIIQVHRAISFQIRKRNAGIYVFR